MNRLGAILPHCRRSSPNFLLLGESSECVKSHSIEQRRTSTFLAGTTFFGGVRVYWYASVSTRKLGNSFATSAATAFTNRINGPDSEPSSLTIALHLSH